jgi:hypothetical protein
MIFCVLRHVSIYLVSLIFSSLTIVTLHKYMKSQADLLEDANLLVVGLNSAHD